MAVIGSRWPEAVAHDPYRNPRVEIGDIPETQFPWSTPVRTGDMIRKRLRVAARRPVQSARSLAKHALRRTLKWRNLGARLQARLDLLRSDNAPLPAASALIERRPILLQNGLCISGYLCSEIGLGQAARNVVYACDTQRLPLSFRNLSLPQRQNEPEFMTKCNQVVDRKANLLVLGLPAIRDLQHELAGGRVNILFPFWELGRIPTEWLKLASRFDEIWSPSSFVASAFAENFDRPVRLVRQPVRLPAAPPAPRSGRDTLRLFTYLDFDSYGTRKNPTAVVNVFQAAFKPTQRDVELIIKVRGADDRGLRKWLSRTAGADRRIRVIDRTFNRTQMDELMASCDVFVSLHRSEGFGFGPAEALAAGKAVVATNYGGTTDFITPTTGYPIDDYILEAVQPGEYIDTAGQVWATVRQEAAVAVLHSIYQDPAEADARALRGFELLRAQNGLSVIGSEIARLLQNLGVL